jgi:hypothetical protein
VRPGRPDLGPIDDVVIPLAHGARLEAREVGSSAGLAVALAPVDLAARDLRQVLLLLLFVGELEQHGPQHRRAEEAHGRRVGRDPCHLLLEDACLLLREASPAVLRGPRGRRVAAARVRL